MWVSASVDSMSSFGCQVSVFLVVLAQGFVTGMCRHLCSSPSMLVAAITVKFVPSQTSRDGASKGRLKLKTSMSVLVFRATYVFFDGLVFFVIVFFF